MSATKYPPGVPPGVPPLPPKGEFISADEQLARWVRGEAVHRRFERVITDADGNELVRHEGEECTPDFACCQPKLLAEPQIRRAFAAASERERMRFLSLFLNAMLAVALPGKRVHVTGGNGGDA